MTKKAFTAVVLIILMFSAMPAAPVAQAAETIETLDVGFDVELTANAAYFINLDSGLVIYEKNANERVHPASTTKIMTAALVMTMCADLENTIVTVPEGVWSEFEGEDVSNAGLKVGEELTMNQLLHCLLLQSANEAAVTIAEYYGYDVFVKAMNDKARELGCNDTNFENPHGFMGDNHYTSARDLAVITQWALSIPGLWDITQKSRYEKAQTNMNEAVTLVTTIEMQDPNSRYYTSYIKGIKTGTLDAAGRCLVSAAQRDGVTYLLVIMGAPYENVNTVWEDGTSSYTDTKLCYDWAFENLKLMNVVDNTEAVTEIKIRHAARRDNLLLYPVDDMYAVDRIDSEILHETRYEIIDVPESIKAPVNEGEVIGRAKVYYGDIYLGETDLVARETIERNVFTMIMDAMTDVLTSTVAKIIYVVLLIVVIFYLYYVKIVVPKAQKKHRKQLAQKKRREQEARQRGGYRR
jgi:D-alanyl-D-alanine carboxypeptidase